MNQVRIDNFEGLARYSRPIFILSYGRSGSTLLRYIVDTHPLITCPGELDLGILSNHLFHTIYYTIGQLSKSSDKLERERESLAKTRQIVMSLMGEYAKARKSNLVRSPLTIDHLSIIHKVFPDARYICLYRSCLDVAYSFITLDRFDVNIAS